MKPLHTIKRWATHVAKAATLAGMITAPASAQQVSVIDLSDQAMIEYE